MRRPATSDPKGAIQPNGPVDKWCGGYAESEDANLFGRWTARSPQFGAYTKDIDLVRHGSPRSRQRRHEREAPGLYDSSGNKDGIGIRSRTCRFGCLGISYRVMIGRHSDMHITTPRIHSQHPSIHITTPRIHPLLNRINIPQHYYIVPIHSGAPPPPPFTLGRSWPVYMNQSLTSWGGNALPGIYRILYNRVVRVY